jgi:hypothetical protein
LPVFWQNNSSSCCRSKRSGFGSASTPVHMQLAESIHSGSQYNNLHTELHLSAYDFMYSSTYVPTFCKNLSPSSSELLHYMALHRRIFTTTRTSYNVRCP